MSSFRPQIQAIRESHGTPSGRGGSRGGGRGGCGGRGGRGGRYQKEKRKLEELQVENQALSRKLASLQSATTPPDTNTSDNVDPVIALAVPTPTNAGDAFGGRSSMQRRSGSNA